MEEQGFNKKERNGGLHGVFASHIIFDRVENWVYELKVPSGILTCQWYLLSTSLTLIVTESYLPIDELLLKSLSTFTQPQRHLGA